MGAAEKHVIFEHVKKQFKVFTRFMSKPQEYCVRLPANPSDFLRDYPNLYRAVFPGDGPVICKLDLTMVSVIDNGYTCRGGSGVNSVFPSQLTMPTPQQPLAPQGMEQMASVVLQSINQLAQQQQQMMQLCLGGGGGRGEDSGGANGRLRSLRELASGDPDSNLRRAVTIGVLEPPPILADLPAPPSAPPTRERLPAPSAPPTLQGAPVAEDVAGTARHALGESPPRERPPPAGAAMASPAVTLGHSTPGPRSTAAGVLTECLSMMKEKELDKKAAVKAAQEASKAAQAAKAAADVSQAAHAAAQPGHAAVAPVEVPAHRRIVGKRSAVVVASAPASVAPAPLKKPKVAPASVAPQKPQSKPSMNHEASRMQFLVRSGLTGKGGSTKFGYCDAASRKKAEVDAKALLQNLWRKHGFA